MEEEKLGSTERREDRKEASGERRERWVSQIRQEEEVRMEKGEKVRKGEENKRCNKSKEARRKVWGI